MKADREETTANPWIEQLRKIPGVEAIHWEPGPAPGQKQGPDALLKFQVDGQRQVFYVECKKGLNEAAIYQIRRLRELHPEHPWILFVDHMTLGMGQKLETEGIHYLDRQGNGDIRLPKQNFLFHVEGRRPIRVRQAGRGIGAPGYKVMFALLAQQELVKEPVRTIAAAAEVGKTTAGEMLDRLREEGFLLDLRGEPTLVRVEELRERWLTGYADVLRPRLVEGIYRTQQDTTEFERRVEAAPPPEPWAWGGAAAAARMVPHYRGDRTILHAAHLDQAFLREARVLPAREGNVMVVAPPCALGLEGQAPHLAHPFLIYAELLAEHNERAREAAAMIHTRYLETPA